MPTALAAAAKHIQDLKAQSLSTLMASIDPASLAAKLGGDGSGSTAVHAAAQAAIHTAEAAIRAVIIEAHPDGRAILQLPGGSVEARLPPEIMRAALANPTLLKPGNTLLLPADIPARPLATQVALSQAPTGTSVGPAPPLVHAFPPGTLGAVIAKLAGIAFPAAEPDMSMRVANLAPPAAQNASPALRPGMLTYPVAPQIAETMLTGASRQIPLGAAISQLLALSPTEMEALPPALTTMLRALQATRSMPEALSKPDTLQEAIARSGLFLEARLAQGGGKLPEGDLKSLLTAIKNEAEKPPAGSSARTEPTGHRTGVEPGERMPVIARAAEGALERVKLMQLASLPNHPEITVTDDRVQPMRLALQIPLATQGGDRPNTAMMGLMIEHQPQPAEPQAYRTDGDGAAPDRQPFPWKIRIALDLDETGPVHAEIGLRGQSVSVTLWAERQSMAQLARSQIGKLHHALTGAAFEIVRLEVKDGVPHSQATLPAEPLLDRRT